MGALADLAIAVVALMHVPFLVLEMFLWTKPLGLKVFRNTPEKAEMTKVLAANQGLYNGFLAAGLACGGSSPARSRSRRSSSPASSSPAPTAPGA